MRRYSTRRNMDGTIDVLDPRSFAFGSLGRLVHALEAARLSELPIPADSVVPHRPGVRGAGVTAAPTGGFVSTQPDETRLAVDHPEIDIPGVVLEAFLGGGGQGWVYAGRVRTTNKVIAVKILARSRDSLDWAAREAILCSRVRHPNVLRVLRTEPAGAFWVVLMEFVQGEDLAKQRLPLVDVRGIIGQLADAVTAIALKRIVHRDIKPANILRRHGDGSPVVIDFGLAIELDGVCEDSDLCGTPFFLPPEAWRADRPTPAWDAYALGVTAAILLAGSPAMPTDLPSLSQAKLSGVFERRLVRAVADVEMREWVEQMTAPEPTMRLDAVNQARNWATV